MDLEYINNQGDLKEIHLGGQTDAEELLIRSVIEALIAANLVTANSYTDGEIVIAKAYTDSEIVISDAYADSQDVINLVAANTYTDDEITSAFSIGATGSFTAGSGEEITVTNGLITAITAP